MGMLKGMKLRRNKKVIGTKHESVKKRFFYIIKKELTLPRLTEFYTKLKKLIEL